jgi:single-stranded-DNA-specific exonuclease
VTAPRSVTGRRWLWRAAEPRAAQGIAQRLEVPELVGRLLAGRGIDLVAAPDFLEPTLRALLPDPSVLIDMDAAAARLAAAVRAREQVAVFADYDVDGACSGALITGLLRELGCRVAAYVPDRLAEGYGPNPQAIAALCDAGATLIVTVDCGIAAQDALAAATGRADVVILDHHKAEGPPPRVVAAVNPNRLDDRSGLNHLCAAGVGFLAGVALLRELRRSGHLRPGQGPDLRDTLDLVALATVCDVMPLTGVNRALVTQGLKVMGRRARPGLAALLEVALAKDAPSAHTLGYLLGPRINAGGRIGDAGLGLRLLTETDPVEARAMAATLDAVNRRRQEVEAEVLDDAFAKAAEQFERGHPTLLVVGQGWHPGVVGIVAGRIRERFNRPALVAGLNEGLAKGSGRSVPGLDLGAAVIAARQMGLLVSGGGHPMAAGFSFSADREGEVHAFLDERLSAAADLPGAADLTLEGSLQVGGATVAVAEQVGRLAPFGPGNEEPIFLVPRARIVRADRVGKEGATIRCFLEGEGGGARLKAVCFRAKEGPLAAALLAGGVLDLAGHLRAEAWNEQVTASLHVVDAARV